MAKVAFDYFGGAQRSPEWFQLRRGRVTASRLADWLAVSKRDGTTPLKARTDYERELAFERQFDTTFEKWFSEPMQDGVDFEDFARKQYETISGKTTQECGSWFNEYFVASPDRMVGKDGLVEIKVLKDTSFTDVLANGVPEKYWQQIQGQLWASGRKWCDFVAINLNSHKLVILTVKADKEFHKVLEKAVNQPIPKETFPNTVYDIVGEIPQGLVFDKLINDEEEDGYKW